MRQVADNYTYDEIQVALTHCGDGNPINWLQENWLKLIETVQTLATKYGQERKENIVGTISAIEAKEALKMHKGNVWHAVTECIEQRQKSFNFINAQGKYLREDIVTYLTVHHGDRELALKDLSRLQLKPFLLKVIGAPAGVDNESGNFAFGNQEWGTAEGARGAEANAVDSNKGEASNGGAVNQNDMLKDLEAIIGSMEQKQSKQTETILSTIENLLGNITAAPNRPHSSASNFSINSYDRMDVKSPILVQPKDNPSQDEDVETDVKNFMSRHIQDIVPGVAAMVDKELNHAANESKQKADAEAKRAAADEEAKRAAADEEAKRAAALAQIEATSQMNMQKVIEKAVDQSSFDEETETLNVNKQSSAMAAEKVQDPIVDKYAEQNPPEIQIGVEETPKEASTSKDNETVPKPKPNSLPKFVINKGISKRNRQYERALIRNIEKQLLKKQKSKKSQKEADDQVQQPDTTNQTLTAANVEQATNEHFDAPSTSAEVPVSQATIIATSNELTADIKQQPEAEGEMSFSMVITEQSQAEAEEVDQSRLSPNISDGVPVDAAIPSTSAQSKLPDPTGLDGSQRNFSELFQDTKNLIQQMKNEIDEDIAMSVSEFDDDTEYYESEDSEEYTDYSGEEELDEEEEEEEDGDEVDEGELDTESATVADEMIDDELDDDQSEEWMDTNGKTQLFLYAVAAVEQDWFKTFSNGI